MANHEKMFGICENKCLVETNSKEDFDELKNSLKSNTYHIVKYNGYQYPIPVMKGDQYSTNGGQTWTTVSADGQLSGPFTGLVKYYGICEGTMPITGTPTIHGNITVPFELSSRSAFAIGDKGFYLNWDENGNNTDFLRLKIVDIHENMTDGVTVSPGRTNGTTFVLGNKAYFCGGRTYSNNAFGRSVATVDVFDSNGNRTSGAMLIKDRTYLISFVIGDKGYVYGGLYYTSQNSNPTVVTTIEIYDINGNRSSGGTIPTDYLCSNNGRPFVLGDKAYIPMGYNYRSTTSGKMVNTVVTYDSNGNFSSATPLAQIRRNFSTFVIGNKGYVCGGDNNSVYPYTTYPNVDIYDINGNRSNGTDLSVGRRLSIAFTIPEHGGFICGGNTPKESDTGSDHYAEYSKIVDKYDVNGNRTSMNSLKYARSLGLDQAFVIKGIKGFVLAGNGETSGYESNIDIYSASIQTAIPLTQYSEYMIGDEYDMATEHITKIITSTTGVLDRTYRIKYQNGIID